MHQNCAHVCLATMQLTFAYARMALHKPGRFVIGMLLQNAHLATMGGQSARTEQSVLVRAQFCCEFMIEARHTNRFPVVCRERMHMCEWSRPNWCGMLH